MRLPDDPLVRIPHAWYRDDAHREDPSHFAQSLMGRVIITDKKLTEHKKGGINEFNCLYEPESSRLITENLRAYGITEDQLSDLIVLIKACCNYEQDKRPK